MSTSGSQGPTILSRIMPTCLQVLRCDDIQEFDSKWDGILLSMTKIPHDDISEGLYTLRIRESEKLKTVSEVFDMEIHQKKAEPDHHRLKAMVKRSIELNLRMKNFEARNGNYERNAVVKNQGTKQREQRTLGDSWQWKANGQCSVFQLFSSIRIFGLIEKKYPLENIETYSLQPIQFF